MPKYDDTMSIFQAILTQYMSGLQAELLNNNFFFYLPQECKIQKGKDLFLFITLCPVLSTVPET